MSSNRSKRNNFKHTRELVQIAINEGMTQEEIARKCRVQQSVVSQWKNGKRKATEQQIAPLLERYGHRLNKTKARVYLVAREFAKEALEETELGRHVLTLLKEEKEPTWEAILGEVTDGTLRRLNNTELRTYLMPTRTVRLEGPIIFRYSFWLPSPQRRRDDSVKMERIPVARWLIHQTHRERLFLIRQVRRVLVGPSFVDWARQLAEWASVHLWQPSIRWVDCADDAARWLSRLHGPLTSAQLLKFVDNYLADPEQRHNPHDEHVLPFLVRKALIEHGHDVLGVEHITATP